MDIFCLKIRKKYLQTILFQFKKKVCSSENVSSRQNHYDAQINKIRLYTRDSRYLEEPMLTKKHMSIDGKTTLYENLVNYSELSRQNLKSYIDGLNEGNTATKLDFVYVTDEDFTEVNKLENLSKTDLKVKIFQALSELETNNQMLLEERYRNFVSKKSKVQHIIFYNEICDLITQKDYDEDDDNEQTVE